MNTMAYDMVGFLDEVTCRDENRPARSMHFTENHAASQSKLIIHCFKQFASKSCVLLPIDSLPTVARCPSLGRQGRHGAEARRRTLGIGCTARGHHGLQGF